EPQSRDHRLLASAFLYTKHSQELLEYVVGTCPKDFNKRDKKQATTPFSRKRQVTFEDQCETLNNNKQNHVKQLNIQKTNVLVIPSTGINSCTDTSRSKPRSNTKKNRISPAKSVNKKKVEEHLKTNKSSLNKTNHNVVSKVKKVWKPKQVKQVWKATGKLITNVGCQWKATGRKFTLGEQCPLTSEDLGKLQPIADIGIFVGYAPSKKGYRIYNKRNRRIMELFTFNSMSCLSQWLMNNSVQDLGRKLMTPGIINLGLVQNILSPTPDVPLKKNDWDSFFQTMFDEYFKPPPNVDHQVPKVPTQFPVASTSSPSSTTIDQDAPSTSTSQTTSEQQSSVIPQGVEDDFYDIEVAHMDNDPYFGEEYLVIFSMHHLRYQGEGVVRRFILA
nr:hypothetical protein [Tanacetum cinerariifolium]